MTGPATPAELAGQAAEAVRALNHATLPGTGGLQYPAGAYEVTGQLAVLAARLPQALAQIHAFLQEQAAAGQVTVVAGQHQGDPAAMLAAVTARPGRRGRLRPPPAPGPRRRPEPPDLGRRTGR